jgi:hypothetical protein
MKTLGVPFWLAFPAAGFIREALVAAGHIAPQKLRGIAQDLFRDADLGLRPDRMGHLLQMEMIGGDRLFTRPRPFPDIWPSL